MSLGHSCFIEALRYQLHAFTSRKLHTAYFHSIELSDRADGQHWSSSRCPCETSLSPCTLLDTSSALTEELSKLQGMITRM